MNNIKIEKVESGEIKKLLVPMPPKSGKSEITAVIFPSWFLGKNQDAEKKF